MSGVSKKKHRSCNLNTETCNLQSETGNPP
jgi:hypothetical protein